MIRRPSFISKVVCCSALYVFWMIMGMPSAPLSPTGLNDLIQHAVVGLPLALLVGLLFADAFLPREELFILNPGRLIRLGLYCLRLSFDIFLAGLDVSIRVLRPRMNLTPVLVEFMTPLKNRWIVMLNANSITLTPGTITVDIRPVKGGTVFTVHCLTEENARKVMSSRGFVDRIEWVYGEANL